MAPTFSNYFICFEAWVSNVRWIEGPFENPQKMEVATPQIHNAIALGHSLYRSAHIFGLFLVLLSKFKQYVFTCSILGL
jgi:hypothetical protein